jgi:2,3-bisphosphoglycerate-independent phosphoglycerate mutase
MKILLMIIDGLGDKPIQEFDNKTPLDSAKTPNLDYLASNGVLGLIEPYIRKTIPTSEESHFSLFGYNPEAYHIKRGIFTAQGVGIKLEKGDIALRGNFATVDDNLKMIDRRAGRIEETQVLVKSLNGIVIDNVKFLLKNTGGYRVGVVLRGKNLSANISDADPFYANLKIKVEKVIALDKNPKSIFTAKVLNEFLEKSHKILKDHPLNKRREEKGLLPANYVLVRGASSLHKIPSFKNKYNLNAACVAGKFLYQQIGKFLGMDLIKVKEADGTINTNLKGKIKAVEKGFKKYDFVFLHIKACDSLAEDGDCFAKKKFIEKIDRSIKPLLSFKDTAIIITCDHSTCCQMRRHCKELIPVLIYKPLKEFKKSKIKFSEKECKKGTLGRFEQINLMSKILKTIK